LPISCLRRYRSVPTTSATLSAPSDASAAGNPSTTRTHAVGSVEVHRAQLHGAGARDEELHHVVQRGDAADPPTIGTLTLLATCQTSRSAAA